MDPRVIRSKGQVCPSQGDQWQIILTKGKGKGKLFWPVRMMPMSQPLQNPGILLCMRPIPSKTAAFWYTSSSCLPPKTTRFLHCLGLWAHINIASAGEVDGDFFRYSSHLASLGCLGSGLLFNYMFIWKIRNLSLEKLWEYACWRRQVCFEDFSKDMFLGVQNATCS